MRGGWITGVVMVALLSGSAALAANSNSPTRQLLSISSTEFGGLPFRAYDQALSNSLSRQLTDPNAFINDPTNDTPLTPEQQKLLKVTNNLIYGSSNYTFTPAMNQFNNQDGYQAPGAPAPTVSQQRNIDFANNVLNGVVGNGRYSAGTAGRKEIISDYRQANGQGYLIGTQAGLIAIDDMRIGTWSHAKNASRMLGLGGSSIAGPVVQSYTGNPSSVMYESVVDNQFSNLIWASPFYIKHSMDDKDGYAGYDYDAKGVSLGFDHRFGNFLAGAAFTYSRGDYDEYDVRDDNTLDNYGFSLYGLYRAACSGFFGMVSGGYNYGDNDLRRWVTGAGVPGWQQNGNDTNSYYVGGTVGYDFSLSNCFTLTPSIGLYWEESRGKAFTSTGAIGNVAVSKFDNKAFIMPLELEASYRTRINECSSVGFGAFGGYTYDFKNDGASGSIRYDFIDALPIAVQGMQPGHSSWNAGANFRFDYKRFEGMLEYRYDGAKDYKAHRVSAELGVKF